MLLGSAYGKVELDSSGVSKGVKSATTSLEGLERAALNIGGAMTNIGNKLTLGLTLPILAAGAASIKYASDLNETKNKAEVIFGDMSKDILKWSETSATALGQSRTQALDAASNFAIFGKAAGLAGDDLVKFAEDNTQLASDFASFFNTSPEEAIIAIGAAYRGESEPIRKYGVLLNEAALQQKALELNIISQLGPLTMQQRILAANALIMDQTKDAQGDFIRTSDGLANSSRILNAQFKDTLATLGQNLLPIALAVTKALNTMLEAFNKMPPGMQKVILVLLGLLALAGPVLVFFGSLITSITAIVGAWPSIVILFESLAPLLLGTVLPAMGSVVAAILPILLVIAAVASAVYLLYLAWKNNFLGIRENVTSAVNIVKNLWKAFTAFLRGDTDAAMEYLQAAFDAFGEHITRNFLKIFNIKDAWARFLEFLRNALSNLVSYIVKAFSNVDWSLIGKYILFGIANGMLFGIPALIAAASKAVKAVLDTFDKGLDAKSPSRKMMQRGVWSGQGYLIGLQNSMDPNTIARTLAKPITNNNNSPQQNITMQFASGLTIQQVRGLIAENNEQLMGSIIGALGGA